MLGRALFSKRKIEVSFFLEWISYSRRKDVNFAPWKQSSSEYFSRVIESFSQENANQCTALSNHLVRYTSLYTFAWLSVKKFRLHLTYWGRYRYRFYLNDPMIESRNHWQKCWVKYVWTGNWIESRKVLR